MHDVTLILTLAGGLTAALLFGYLTHRLGLSPIVGYLLGGMLVGPHTPGFVADAAVAEQLAEVGVILLMFGVGLQFHIDELLSVRRVAIPGAVLQSAAATGLGAALMHTMGWTWSASVVFGLSLSVASTVVLVRVLADNRDFHTPTGHISIGWLVVEDIFTVVVLVVLPAVFTGEHTGIVRSLVLTFIKVAGLIVFTGVVGVRIIPWLLDRVAATRSRELFTLTVLVVAIGIAVGSALLFGVSMALGAFLAGMIVGRSEYSLRAASDALPMRDAFAVLFFVSVGMLLDPRHFLEAPGLIAATLAIVVVGKPMAAALVVLAMRYPATVAAGVAVALAQIGEFSFILISVGRDLRVIPPDAMPTIVAVAILSILLNPLAYRTVRPWLARRLAAFGPAAAADEGAGEGEVGRAAAGREADPHRAVVVGYGPTGRTLTRLLRENGVAPSVIEMNMQTVRALRESGVAAVYGDATLRETQEAAGVASAGHFVVAADISGAAEVVRIARELNPRIRVLARTTHLRDVGALRHAGAESIFSGEGEVALALMETVLQRLHATPEQIDRERARVRHDLMEV